MDQSKHKMLQASPIKGLLLFISFFMALTHGYSQQKPFRIYTVSDGLISNAPQQIFQDSDGFIWIGSNEGMSIYDGNHFVNYTTENKGLSNNVVDHFFQRDKNEVWVLHSNGIDKFVGRKFIKTLPIKGIGFMMWTRNHRILATGRNGIYEFRNDKPHPIFSSEKYFYGLIEIGNYFIANENPWESSVLFDRSFHALDTFAHHGTFLKDKSNCWWFGDRISLLDTLALKKGLIRLLPAPAHLNQINHGHISYPFTDSDGFIWVSSDKGITRIDKEGRIKRFNLSSGLNTIWTSSFYEDREGNIWAQGTGFIKFSSKYVDIFTENEGLSPEAVGSIAEDSYHNAWIAQANGMSCLYQNKIYKFNYPDLIRKGASYPTIMIQGDSLWLAYFGLWLFKIHCDSRPHLQLMKKWLSYQQKRLIYASEFCPYHDGNVLINFDDGLFRITKNGQLQKIRDPSFFKFLVSGDEIWSGSVVEGVDRWKIIKVKDSLRLQLIRQYKNLPGLRVLTMAKDSAGNIWMGTYYKGVVKFEKQNDDSFLIRNYDIQNGLTSNLVYNMFIDHTGKIYINTSHGFCLLHANHDSVYFENLSPRYGFIDQLNNITGNEKGDLWLSAGIGAIRINNNQHQKNLPPKVFISQVLCNNKPDTLLDFHSIARSFSYKQNNLVFEFSATTFRNEDQVLYSYQLQSDKNDTAWSQPQKIHNLSFAALSSGHYTFKLKALTADNVWSKIPTEYSFIILPPFYETWWFRLSILFLVVTLISIFYWYRLSQLKKLFELRTKISRDLHDEIGSTLTSINILSKVSQSSLEKNTVRTSDLLEKITEQSHNIQQSMSDIVWAIHPDHDKMENMAIRMREYLGQTAEAKDLEVEFHVDEKVLKQSLSMQKRKDVFLIFKESVNNAIKYSGGKNIKVFLGKENNHIKLSIRDDGIGFIADDITSSSGLKNMHDRAKNLNGTLNIQSSPGKGTLVEFICLAT